MLLLYKAASSNVAMIKVSVFLLLPDATARFVKHMVNLNKKTLMGMNKAGYTATPVACGWAGAIFEVSRPFGQDY